MKRPFAVIGFTVFFTGAFLFDKETGVTAAALAVFAVALVVALFSKKIREAQIMPLCAASGAVTCVLLIVTNTFVLAPAVAYAGGEHHLKAQITDEVSIQYGKYYFDATSVTVDGESVKTDLRLVFSTPPDIKPYDYVEGDFAFYQPGGNYEEYLNANRSKGLFLGAYPVSEDYVITETPESEKPFAFKLIGIKNKIKRTIYNVYPDENGALAVAMILGDKSEISTETYNSLREAGIVHLICVSGLHLSLWASLILAFLRSVGLREKLACIIAAVGVVFFMALTGFSHSVLRAGIMMLVYLASKFASRDPDSINSLGFSVTVIALILPYSMASASLQLSVLATLGILCANEFIVPETQKICDRIPLAKLRAVVQTAVSALVITLSATMFIQPVMLRISGGFSFACVISNLFITPFAGGAMVAGALSAGAGRFLPAELNFFQKIGETFLQYIIRVSEFIASKAYLHFTVEEDAAFAVLCVVFLFVCVTVLLAFVYKPKPLAMSGVVCAVFMVSVVAFATVQKNETRIRIVDTGNGVSVFVAQGDENVLVGCGGTSYTGEYGVINALQKTNGTDCLVLPSADKTASAYAVEVLGECNVGRIYCDSLPDNAAFLTHGKEICPLDGEYTSDGLNVRFGKAYGETAVLVKTKDISLLICATQVNNLSPLPQEFKEADMLVCLSRYPADTAEYMFDYTVICANNQNGVTAQNELIYKGVNAVATGGCGDVAIKASEGEFGIGRE